MRRVFFLLLLFTFVTLPGDVWADESKDVTLPDFEVIINGVAIDNTHREYPFIVYNDITYFPMTYYDCRYLGVVTEWDQGTGLSVSTDQVTGSYFNYFNETANIKNG